jgi:hypothetical protein
MGATAGASTSIKEHCKDNKKGGTKRGFGGKGKKAPKKTGLEANTKEEQKQEDSLLKKLSKPGTRLEQIIRWLKDGNGDEADPLIVLDECHKVLLHPVSFRNCPSFTALRFSVANNSARRPRI